MTLSVDQIGTWGVLANASTSGPWEPRRLPGMDPYLEAQFTVSDSGGNQIADCYDNARHSDAQITANAAFIAAAREAVPALITEVEGLRAENEKLREAVREACRIAESASAVITSEGLDFDNETPGILRRLGKLRALTEDCP